MKLARVIRTGGSWVISKPSLIVDTPQIGTIVQYERYDREWCSVFFPGVQGYATLSGWAFDRYFEPL